MGVKVVFLANCPLVLSLLKHRGVEAFLNKKKKMSISNRGSLLNSSIDTCRVVGVIGSVVYVYVYIGPGPQSEDIK